ncbi:tether containing UBX domain for GLUT4-like isoform X4 [Clupea harengus]|uniref:Tether containing UBX domain for GLUT4-like isoform X4 n=1 Tax=Clupea harengus TaxID=7950 RepID=A0A6P8F7Q8_CLUHA|nr:tether containing UBX domain for GLUT4-like isoform X4 [Clupea harengus]
MGPKKGRRNLKRLKTTEVAERAKEPPDPQDNSEPGAFVPFSGAGHSLGEGCGLRRLPVDGRKCNVKPAAGYLLFPEPQTKWPPVSEGIQESKNVKHLKSDTKQTEFLEPVDRKMLVYHMDARAEPSTDVNEEDLPEDFFQVTSEDVKKRYAQLQTDRRELEEAPLLTSALREDHMIRQMQRHPKVVIRICFPDRHVLQGVFRPLETVGNLKQFVRNHLIDPQLQFCLYGAPRGMRMEDPRETLYEANLFPNALLYFSSGPETGCFLHPRYLSATGSVAQADAAVQRKKMKICSEEKWLSLQEWNTLFLAGIKQEHFWFFLPLTQNLL